MRAVRRVIHQAMERVAPMVGYAASSKVLWPVAVISG